MDSDKGLMSLQARQQRTLTEATTAQQVLGRKRLNCSLVAACLVIAFGFLLPVIQGELLRLPHTLAIGSTTGRKNVTICTACKILVKGVFKAFDAGKSDDQISNEIGQLCNTVKLYSSKVCSGVASIAMPTIRYIYQSGKVIRGNICGMVLQDENCPIKNVDSLEWTVEPSKVTKPLFTPFIAPPANSPTIKVLHMADLHWDPEYLEGSLANCKDPLCCRASSGTVTNASDAAGYWGDYRTCDMPLRTIENAMSQMAQQHPDVAYIIWTGDLVPHNLWSTTKAENLMINDKMLSLVKQYFPNTPLYPTLGNHESSPANAFAPPEVSDTDYNTAWLYNDADLQWSQWLPADASSTIRYGGYYTALVQPGLRIVSMNMNYCYTLNWWTLYKSQDPASGLAWLVQILENAEQASEKVHIISHIPPGGYDCWSIFSREFSKIISRFESTVAAQFYGHTHNEEFKVYYDTVDSNRPVNVAFIAGSLTTYINLNPSYRVYTIDGDRSGSTRAVLDFSTWIFNLTAANQLGAAQNPVWYELYQARKEYGLSDLSPQSMDDFFQRMLSDDALVQLYFKNFNKAADVAVSGGCGSKCRVDLLCNMVTTDFAEQVRCIQIQHRIFRIKSVNLLALRLYRFRSCLLRNMRINPLVRLNQLRLCLARYVSGEY